ncbi:MAG: hypothetical protein ILO36_01285, partial [Abditibacteriota bacterium]|nr:hypothetical protein [Abditibacteriota bacterium]
ANDLLAEAGMKVFDERVFADISKNWKRIKFSERFADSRNVNAPRQLFFWQKGRVFRYWLQGEGIKSEEHLYIHFRKRNYQMPPRLPGEDDAVIVAPGSLLVKKLPDGGPDRQTVCSLNPYRGRLFEAIECKTLCHIPGYIKK